MTTETSYREWQKQDYGKLIDALQLNDMQKHFMRSRWLDQVMWMESKCEKTQQWHYMLRLTAIIGGVTVPTLVSMNASDAALALYPKIGTTVLSLLVAISVAVEEFFHFGERWRHYRRTVELLKINAWQFFQRSGPYQQFTDHGTAYSAFAGKVEEIMQNEVDVFVTDVVKERKEEKKE